MLILARSWARQLKGNNGNLWQAACQVLLQPGRSSRQGPRHDHHLARCVQAPFDEQCEAHPGPRLTVSSPEEALQQHLSRSGGSSGSAHVAAAEAAVAEADGPHLVGSAESDAPQAAVLEQQLSTADDDAPDAAPGQLQHLQQPWEAAAIEAFMLSPFQQMSQLQIASSGRLSLWDHAAVVDTVRTESAVYFDTQDG